MDQVELYLGSSISLIQGCPTPILDDCGHSIIVLCIVSAVHPPNDNLEKCMRKRCKISTKSCAVGGGGGGGGGGARAERIISRGSIFFYVSGHVTKFVLGGKMFVVQLRSAFKLRCPAKRTFF